MRKNNFICKNLYVNKRDSNVNENGNHPEFNRLLHYDKAIRKLPRRLKIIIKFEKLN